MAETDWRVWLKQKVDGITWTGDRPPVKIIAAGSAEENINERPFIVIKAGLERRGPFPGVTIRDATIWVHDEPGTYMDIDKILADLKAGLEGQVTEPGGVAARWMGDSVELADDFYKTITRNQSYSLHGKDG